MNRQILSAVLLAGTILSAAPALAETIGVANGQSIQSAIDRAKAGDAIVVRSETKGGAHVIARGANQPAIASYGQSNVSILGFRVTSERGDGMKVGGSPGKMASNITVEDNIVESAWLDGLKAFQTERLSMNDNEIKASGVAGAAGKGANSNGDGGIDWVQVNNSEMTGNTVSSRGWACAMVKTGSNGNDISDNRFVNCEVNGIDMAAPSSGRAAAANDTGMVAFDNEVQGNTINSGSGCAIKLAEKTRNNRITGNQTSGRNCADPTGTNNEGANVDVSNSGSSSGTGDAGGGEFVSSRQFGASIGGSCAGSGALSAAMSAAGSIASIWNGGKATAPLQVAQQAQLVAQRLCQTEQLAAQIKMLAGIDLRSADDVLWSLRQLESILKQSGIDDPGPAYPTVFGSDTFEKMEDQQTIWTERTRKAMDRKSQIENAVLQEQKRSLQRAGQIEQAGRASGGIRGAQLATNALLNELMGSLNNQMTATVAHQRALAEVQYRQEAEKEAAKTMAGEFMSTLSQCTNCDSSKPLLGN